MDTEFFLEFDMSGSTTEFAPIVQIGLTAQALDIEPPRVLAVHPRSAKGEAFIVIQFKRVPAAVAFKMAFPHVIYSPAAWSERNEARGAA